MVFVGDMVTQQPRMRPAREQAGMEGKWPRTDRLNSRSKQKNRK